MNDTTKKTIAIATSTLALLLTWHSEAAAGGEDPAGVAVARLMVARDVRNREPVDEATEFSVADTTHLFAFVEFENPTGEPAEVHVSWIDTATGKARKPYLLQVGAKKRFRTWARAAAPKRPGTFEVVLTDVEGAELARAQFTMKE
jgi:hypothetical protein